MQKDITEKELVQCNDVFADIYNEGIFGGKKILREEDLLPLPTDSITRNMDGTVRQGFRDVRKADRRSGTYRLIWNLENQSGTDNTMPERVMGYEYASYEEQIKALMAENRKAGKPAFTKRIHEDQKLVPVITAVLNWDENEWSGPRHLHEMLKFPAGLEEELRPMAADYSFHLIEVGSLTEEVRNRFQSDFRVLAEYAATRKESEKWEAFLREYPKKLDHPEELFDALKAVAGDERYEQIAEQLTKEEKEEGVRMCVVAEKLERIGIEKGMEKGIEKGIEMGRMEERANTEREKHRAMIAEQEVLELRRELERLKNSRS